MEGVFADLVRREGLSKRIQTDSAGVWDGFVGSAPERRTQASALRRGIDLSALRARVVEPGDYAAFDLVLGMEHAHVRAMHRECGREHRDKIVPFMDFVPDGAGRDVPDPYFGEADGFELVLDLAETGSEHLLAHVRARWLGR